MQPYIAAVSEDAAQRQIQDLLRKVSKEAIAHLILALKTGMVRGDSIHEDMIGIIATANGISGIEQRRLFLLFPYQGLQPVDAYTFCIQHGDTPKNNLRVQKVYEWCIGVFLEEHN